MSQTSTLKILFILLLILQFSCSKDLPSVRENRLITSAINNSKEALCDTLNTEQKDSLFNQLVYLWSEDYLQSLVGIATDRDSLLMTVFNHRLMKLRQYALLCGEGIERIPEIYYAIRSNLYPPYTNSPHTRDIIIDDVIVKDDFYPNVNRFIYNINCEMGDIHCWPCGINNTLPLIRSIYLDFIEDRMSLESFWYRDMVRAIRSHSNECTQSVYSGLAKDYYPGDNLDWTRFFFIYYKDIQNKVLARIHINTCGIFSPPTEPGSSGGGITPPDPETEQKCPHSICQNCGRFIRESQTRSASLPATCAGHIYCECGSAPSVTLTVNKSDLTLGEDFIMSISVSNPSARINYIEYNMLDKTLQCYTENFSLQYQSKARCVGAYPLSVKLRINGITQDIHSNLIPITIRYPSAKEIMAQPEVIEGVNLSWANTLSSANRESITEYGGVVMLNTLIANTGPLYRYIPKRGQETKYGDKATILLDFEDADYGFENGVDQCVLIFHTHPPFWNYKGSKPIQRKCGASDDDIKYHTTIPAVVKDFEHPTGLITGFTQKSEYENTAKLYYYGLERKEN